MRSLTHIRRNYESPSEQRESLGRRLLIATLTLHPQEGREQLLLISYCGNGIKGQYSNVHSGWVCSTELTPDPKL
jgi:hypothetical protein